MSDDDDNIEFDFFEEPKPEPAPRRGIPRPRRSDEPPRPPVHLAPGLMPVLRLTGLVAGAIVIVIVLVAALKGCSSSSGAYKSYMDKVGTIATQSADLGTKLNRILATPALNEASLERQLNGLVESSDSLVTRAQKIAPPGKLSQQHQQVLAALGLRRTALQRLLQTFKRTAKEKTDATIGTLLVQQVHDRLLASDVMWRDLFQQASKPLLPEGVAPPASVFLAKPDNLDATSLENLWKRVRTTAANGNVLRGTELVSVKVLPQGDFLGSTSTTIKASTNLQFAVTVKDTGERQEAKIAVTLTILQQTPIVLHGTIDVINPGDTKTILLGPYPGQPQFGTPLRIKVDVSPVPHEARLSNNTAEYPVEFQV